MSNETGGVSCRIDKTMAVKELVEFLQSKLPENHPVFIGYTLGRPNEDVMFVRGKVAAKNPDGTWRIEEQETWVSVQGAKKGIII